MFVDASAFCAILLDEPERKRFELAIASADQPVTSAVAIWETARTLVRAQGIGVGEATSDVEAYIDQAEIEVVLLGRPESRFALEAFDRFGKGRHPAMLNMGDCFAYACAKSYEAPLL